MQSQNLIIITKNFPCVDHDDQFETELICLSKYFNIKIITLDYDSPLRRPLPQNVTFLRLPSQSGAQKFFRKVGHMPYPVWHREMKSAKQLKKSNVGYPLYSLEKLVYSKHLADFIISQDEFDDDKPLILYSYGITDASYGIITAKKKRKKNVKTVIKPLDLKYHAFEAELNEKSDLICFENAGFREEYLNFLKIKGKAGKNIVYGTGTLNKGILNPERKFDGLNIVSYCKIDRDSNFYVFAEALCKIPDIRINWTHFGGGRNLLELKNFVDEAFYYYPNISYRFELHPSREMLDGFYADNHVDFYLSLDTSEEEQINMMQCMSYGIYVMALDNPYLNGLIDNNNGVVLPPVINSDTFSKALHRINFISLKEITKKRQLALATWKTNFNAENIYKTFAGELALHVDLH